MVEAIVDRFVNYGEWHSKIGGDLFGHARFGAKGPPREDFRTNAASSDEELAVVRPCRLFEKLIGRL